MVKGDIVLITFPFTDLSGSKLRPAVVLTETTEDITVAFVSTQIGWKENNDILLSATAENGLKKQSLIRTNKIATLDKDLARGLIGRLGLTELAELNSKLKSVFQL